MTDSLLAKYDRAVPRYTSYPTAAQFHPGVDAIQVAAWLAATDPATPLSFYLHVPFCKQMCWYCGCHTRVAARYEPVRRFAERLTEELEQTARIFGGRRRLAQIHWGGGTPNMLAPDDFRRLMMAIGHLYDIEPGCEIALELDPRLMSGDLLRALRDGGVNRVSLGVQDFDVEVQAAINRVQPYDEVRAAIDALRGIGIGGLNLDLIYGLPKQTPAGFRQTVELALSLDPDRLAIFGYAHVPWMKAHQRLIDEATLPDAAQRFAMAESAARQLIAAGYRRIGLDHFAKSTDALALALEDRSLRRNFQGYTADPAETLVGFGPSAISALPQGFAQNLAETGAWSQAVAKGHPAIARGVALTGEDRMLGAIIERLMCFGEVDFGRVALELGAAGYGFRLERARLAPLVADGLAELRGTHLRVTERGMPYQRIVAAAFDAYFNSSPARHSRAV